MMETTSLEGTYHLNPLASQPLSSGIVVQTDPAHAKSNIDHIRRFRILIIGRANAGKTTILQRLCNTTDQPEIYDSEGKKRGHHDIEDELIFRSNPRFVFHDSCGFECGSEMQFRKMKEFVMHRASTPNLEKRIHAIWFCIPLTDSHRMVTTAERKFFDECYTGHVPVIVLLTKADALQLDAMQELQDEGLTDDEAMEGVADIEREMLNEHLARVKGWLNKSKFPPRDFQPLTGKYSGMEQECADCSGLLACTANALNEEGLQKLLISTQQSSLAVCIEFAVMK
ncbi:GTP-binding protein [Pisolithus croceorrhizus]|nr:GTP-binding protein [Pisolithus croceorrhizus]